MIHNCLAFGAREKGICSCPVQVTGTARNVLILTVDDLMLPLISSIVVVAMSLLPLQITSLTHEITQSPN